MVDATSIIDYTFTDFRDGIQNIAKQIKEDTKEDAEPPKPVLEAILRRHENSVG